ncbi:MAG: polysaccharide deacetylase family protein [Pseudomonadota bacterium]
MAGDKLYPPRDLIGFGPEPPDPQWPNGARLAVNFCINYEEGGELCLSNGDDCSETRLSDLTVDAKIGERDLNMESNYEFGSRVGFWRIMKAFQERGLPATVNLVGRAGEQNPPALSAIKNSGFDIQCHGWRWIDHHGLDEAIERDHIARCIAQAKKLTGEEPLGYYAGMPSRNTRRLVIEQGDFLYDSDCYNDELPFWSRDYGRPHLIVPYSLDTNDSRFTFGVGYRVAEEFVTYIKDSFDCLYGEGLTHPKMMTIGLHGRLIGRPGRIGALYRILDYIQSRREIWICRRGDLAKHWIKMHPPAEG